MLNTLKTIQSLPLLLLTVCAISLLNGCGTASKEPQSAIDAPSITEQVQDLLLQASNSENPREAHRLQIKAAQLLQQQGKNNLASQLLANIKPQQLHREQLGTYTLLYSGLLLDSGDIDGALLQLNREQLLFEVDLMSLSTQIGISDLRARALSLRGSHLASVQERIYIAPLLEEQAQMDYNREAIWQSLMFLSKEELAEYLAKAITDDYQGWLELAIIAKGDQGDLDAQVAELEQWQFSRQGHPAAQQLPDGMAILKETAANRPRQLALLLPLSGKIGAAGQTIRDGFLAALYHGQKQSAPQVRLYDTEQSTDFSALYQQAVNDGAELIIGPLTKDKVRLLYDMVELPVPTLALNQIDDYGAAPEQLYQFGLSTADESQQVAELAFLENHKNAMILATDNAWGHKAALAFSDRWQALGGNIVAEGRYLQQDSYTAIIQQLFQLDLSEQRARDLRTLTGLSFEFEPRRRQDIDMIFLLARPHHARSIKPILAFHYGSDIPVYGTSHIYSGTPAPIQDRDLNGIKFSDMPWILKKNNLLREQITEKIAPDNNTYLRLYALGVDSYRLYPRLTLLERFPQSRMYGETGNLNLTGERIIKRRLMWARMHNGHVQALPMIAYNDAIQDKQDANTTRSKE